VNDFPNARNTDNEDREPTPQETRAKTSPPQEPLSLTFTRHKGGGFIGKQLIGPDGKFQTICAGKDFIDEVVACKDFDHVAAMIAERAQDGEWAISLGMPAHRPSGPHSHEAADYLDAPTRLFFGDADGVFAKGLGSARKFDAAAKYVVSLMGDAFKNAAYLALRTTRTGSDKNRVFIRFLFLLRTPATLVQMGAVAKGLSNLPAFTRGVVAPQKTTIDLRLYREGHFVFIASPQCAPGVIDAASSVAPVKVEGGTLNLNEAAKALGIDLANVSAKRRTTRTPGVAASDKRRVSPIAPGAKNQEFLTALVHSIPNGGKFDNRDRTGAATGEGSYIGMAHAIFGACSSEPGEFGRALWLEWAGSWHQGGDPEKDERVWDTLDPNGDNGFWDLMDYARAFGGSAGLRARWDIMDEINPEMSAEQLDSLARAHVGDIPDWVLEMNTEYAFSRDRPEGVIVRGDDKNIIKMLTRQELRNIYANELIRVPAGKNKDGSPKTRLLNKGDAWFSHRARAQYRGWGPIPSGGSLQGPSTSGRGWRWLPGLAHGRC
jgi:hypothetical protein